MSTILSDTKLSQVSDVNKNKYGLMKFVTETPAITEIIDVFAKYGIDLRVPGDAVVCEITPDLARELKKFDTRNRRKNSDNLLGIMGDLPEMIFTLVKMLFVFLMKGLF